MSRDAPTSPLGPLFDRLLAHAPGSAAATALQHDIEHRLMTALREGGRAAGEALVESLGSQGFKLRRLDILPCMWRILIPRPRVLEVWFTGGDLPVVAALSYRTGSPTGTRAQRQAAALHSAFYTRYEALCAAGAVDPASLAPGDALIVRVAEFEADVQNGGFGQYLQNKGEARGRAVLACLQTIGATRTANGLSAALRPGATWAHWERLDRQFNRRPEDLAALVMKHLAG